MSFSLLCPASIAKPRNLNETLPRPDLQLLFYSYGIHTRFAIVRDTCPTSSSSFKLASGDGWNWRSRGQGQTGSGGARGQEQFTCRNQLFRQPARSGGNSRCCRIRTASGSKHWLARENHFASSQDRYR